MPKSVKCSKCGGTMLTVKYHAGSTEAEESLTRKCRDCGYTWDEPCEDKL